MIARICLLLWRRYPHALYFLDMLQTPEFRAKIANPAYKEMVHTQQVGWEGSSSRASATGGVGGQQRQWAHCLRGWPSCLWAVVSCPQVLSGMDHLPASDAPIQIADTPRRAAGGAGCGQKAHAACSCCHRC